MTDHINPVSPDSDALDSDSEEIEVSIDVTEENLIWLHTPEWEIYLAPEEARMVGQALMDAAEDAEGGTE